MAHMTSSEIRRKFIEYYKERGHAVIPSAPLVPENDPTTLFTSSGMQPLIPYLLGSPHPLGKRLVDSQKSFRSQDIEEVGDNRHTTFFEMLGNWSLGDYFKKEQLPWIFGFLTNELKLDPRRLYVSVFEGNESVPKDEESIAIWKSIFAGVGIDAKEGERIFAYPAKKNWWSRSGEPDKMPVGEPGGPDSEVFFDFGLPHDSKYGPVCHPNCDCGRFMEIANSVFMQYTKDAAGMIVELSQKNVDFGGGLERMCAAVSDNPDVFFIDTFAPLIGILEKTAGIRYGTNPDKTRAMRIIADHIRGAVMMMSEGVVPSNKGQGYILRRLIRRSLLYGRNLGVWKDRAFLVSMVEPVAEVYADAYPAVSQKKDEIAVIIDDEAGRFGKTVDKGLTEMEKMGELDGRKAFVLYETYGFPWELTEEMAREKGQTIDRAQFEEEFRKHQALSRTAAAGMFKGGLADHSQETTKLHTATHLLHQALRTVLGTHVGQKGSNITVERLRFDFSHPGKMTEEEIREVEHIVNEAIKENLPVNFTVMDKKAALESGALGFFTEKYGDKVKVYTVGIPGKKWFSREICGGPHVAFTGELGHFTIIKEESASAGVRRIYARVGNK